MDTTDTYKELTKVEARLLNKENYYFIYTHFIDNSKATLTKQADNFFIKECLSFTDNNGIIWTDNKIATSYFYFILRIHKKPFWKSSHVVS